MRPLLVLLVFSSVCQAQTVTHGPVLGRPGATSMGVWIRTDKPAPFRIRYGFSEKDLDHFSREAETVLDQDATGWVLLDKLVPNRRYYYQAWIGDNPSGPVGSFRTLPHAKDFKNDKHNPQGLFNFRFEVGSCANQGLHSQGQDPVVFKTMLNQLRDRCLFSISNGDHIYEEGRDFSAQAWMKQQGIAKLPRNVELAPTLTGVWENYKIYLKRSPNLSAWMREIPTYFTFDDHEILNDVAGCGEIGYSARRTVFRDIGVQGWYDYVGWSNPVAFNQGIHLGHCELKAGQDVLVDSDADFTKLDLKQLANLHVHWGTPDAGVNEDDLDKQPPANPNAAVYGIAQVLDKHRLKITPAAKKDSVGSYSIGRRSYYKFRVANCDFFVLDTRTHRMRHDIKRPDRPDVSMLGAEQKKWLLDGMAQSDADAFFVVSSVNFMIPHDGAGGMAMVASDKDDAWTVFLHERDELIQAWDKLRRPVMVFTGDLHNSFAVKASDFVWEFASGPLNSRNHNAGSEGARPANGLYKSRNRMCDIRWSTHFLDDVLRDKRKQPVYLLVQVNNAFNNPLDGIVDRWVAYPHPQIVLQYFDGGTGELLYAESLRAGKHP